MNMDSFMIPLRFSVYIKKTYIFSGPLTPRPPPTRAVSGHSDFKQVFFTCIDICL